MTHFGNVHPGAVAEVLTTLGVGVQGGHNGRDGAPRIATMIRMIALKRAPMTTVRTGPEIDNHTLDHIVEVKVDVAVGMEAAACHQLRTGGIDVMIQIIVTTGVRGHPGDGRASSQRETTDVAGLHHGGGRALPIMTDIETERDAEEAITLGHDP